MDWIAGRIEEVEILNKTLTSNQSELIAVYGRRRIGKTYLIRKFFKSNIVFEFSGMLKASNKDHLEKFHFSISEKEKKFSIPKNWLQAFSQLQFIIDKSRLKRKKVVFIDEFPWLDVKRSKFLMAFESFWNSYASKRNDLIVVICGSAASYMIQKIIKNKGGLHNRITRKIRLEPFTLNESEYFLKRKGIKFSRYDILILYMAMGGVPHYLNQVDKGESVTQVIDRLCFTKDGFLRTEFENVFASLFDQYENHEAVIRALSKKKKGLTRDEISSTSKVSSGGTLTKTLIELEESGFVENYNPYKGKKGSLNRLVDEYSNFYLKYIEKSKPVKGSWMVVQNQPSFVSWAGFSFESICMKHIQQLKKGLKIEGVLTTSGSWVEKRKDKGAQIDLLIDRSDNIIHIAEMKFSKSTYTITKKYASELSNKLDLFQKSTQTKKSIWLLFVTTFGIEENSYSHQLVQNSLKMDILFD